MQYGSSALIMVSPWKRSAISLTAAATPPRNLYHQPQGGGTWEGGGQSSE